MMSKRDLFNAWFDGQFWVDCFEKDRLNFESAFNAGYDADKSEAIELAISEYLADKEAEFLIPGIMAAIKRGIEE